VIDVPGKKVRLVQCQDAIFDIAIKRKKGPQVDRVVKALRDVVIQPKSIVGVPVHYGDPLPTGRDYAFESSTPVTTRKQGPVYAYHQVVDEDFRLVYVRNEADHPVTIKKSVRLGRL
jgi:hypothetical protein